MSYIPEKMRNKEPYTPVSGTFDIRLDANESPFDIPIEIKREFMEVMFKSELNRYPDPSAAALREAFGKRFGIKAENIVAGNGSDEIILLLMLTLLDKEDQVAVTEPDFSMYSFYADMAGAKVNTMKKTSDFSIKDFGQFVKNTGSKLCIFSNPCNPTGEGIPREEILEFVKNCSGICVVDEAYMDFWNQSIIDEVEKFDNLIVLKTMSKAFGGAGLRLGFAVGNQEFVKALNVNRSPYNINTMSQVMGTILLEKAKDSGAFLGSYAKEMVPVIRNIMPNSKVYDTCGNLIYIEMEKAEELYCYLKSRKIAIRKFGDSALRITVSYKDEMEQVVETIREWSCRGCFAYE